MTSVFESSYINRFRAAKLSIFFGTDKKCWHDWQNGYEKCKENDILFYTPTYKKLLFLQNPCKTRQKFVLKFVTFTDFHYFCAFIARTFNLIITSLNPKNYGTYSIA